MTFVSYAQNFEDVILWRALKEVENGQYLDIGAQDPVVDSVSLAFYERGWRGIHVEPVPLYAARLREARPDETVIEAAVTDETGPIEFYELGGLSTGRSSVAELHERAGNNPQKILVTTVRLERLFEFASADVHWLKIDVEGMEADVLRSWGKSDARPWVVAIESTVPNSQEVTEHSWIDLILERGYEETLFDGLNRYFVHESHPELCNLLKRPANVFDDFQITKNHFAAALTRQEFEAKEEKLSTQQFEFQSQIEQANAAAQTALAERVAEQASFRSDIAKTENALASLREQYDSTVQQMVRAERDHTVALQAIWRERNTAEKELRRELDARVEKFREAMHQSRAAEAEARADLARLEDKRNSLEHELSRTKDRLSQSENEILELRIAVEHARVSAAIARTEMAQEHSRHKAEIADSHRIRTDLANQVARYKAAASRLDDLIRAAIAERHGWWQRLGEFLGFARVSTSWHALAKSNNPGVEHPSTSRPSTIQSTGKETETPMRTLAPAETRNPYLRANSLSELLAWDDLDFVRCAYVTVLGRQPDPQGETYYAERLRGGVPKMQILWNLRRSPEGANHDPGITGFDRALKRARLMRPFMRRVSSQKSGPGRASVSSDKSDHSHSDAVAAEEQPVQRAPDYQADHEALIAEIDKLNAIVDGLGHALTGVTRAQARHEQELKSLADSVVAKARGSSSRK